MGLEQHICVLCGSAFLGTDLICRLCRLKHPEWDVTKMAPEDVPPPPIPTQKEKVRDQYLERLTHEEIPFPTGKVTIPTKEDRDYRATIVLTTPDIGGENFRFCKYRLDKHTPGEHRLIVVETHFNEKPYNYARDINIGLRGVQDSDYLIMLNDDIFVEQGWLDTMVECARQDPKIGIVGALLFYPGKRIIQHAGGLYDTSVESWVKHGTMPVKHSYGGLPLKYSKHGVYTQKDVPWNTGALLLVTKACIDKSGLMDEKLVAHCDDVEYNFRAWLNGFRVVYCPDVQAIHRENVTRKHGTKESPQYIFDALRHLLQVLPKKKADKVQDAVDKSNKKHYPVLDEQ